MDNESGRGVEVTRWNGWQVPDVLTYNPVYDMTYAGVDDPTRGHVYHRAINPTTGWRSDNRLIEALKRAKADIADLPYTNRQGLLVCQRRDAIERINAALSPPPTTPTGERG